MTKEEIEAMQKKMRNLKRPIKKIWPKAKTILRVN